MARLPSVGGDAGNWGDILNNYLVQSHAADGTLKTDSVGAPQLKPGAVTSAALAPGSVTSAKIDRLGQAGGVATLDTNGNILTASGQPALTSSILDTETAGKINDAGSATAAALNVAFVKRKPNAFDSFAGKADAVLTSSTKLDSGQAYSVHENAAGLGYKTLGGVMTHSVGTTANPAAAYAGLDIGERVGRIWAEFTLPAGTAWETLVLVVSTSSFTNPAFANSASHFVLGPTNYSYEVLTASPFATTVIESGTFDTPLVAGTKYQVSLDFDGDTATISLPAPVNGYATAVAQDTRIDTFRGQFATIENYSHTGNANTPIHINRWGAEGVTNVDLSEAHASRADVKKAIDAIPVSGVLPDAPSSISYAANPVVSLELSTTPAALNTANLTLDVKFPPSGKVCWSAQVWLWMNTGGASGATGYFGVLEGVTFKAGIKAVSATDVERLYSFSGVLTDTPGVTRTYQLAGYASNAAKINFLSDQSAGVEGQFTLTPLAA